MSKTLRSPQHMRLLRLLLELRNSKSVTQIALAVQLGRPQSFVSKYESGERRLDLIELCDVVRALGANPIEFLTEFLKPIEDGKPERAKGKAQTKRAP